MGGNGWHARPMRRGATVALVVTASLAPAACSDDGGGSVEAFCTTARAFAEDNPATVFDRYDPADPTAAAELLRAAGEQLRSWADEAPDDVDDDVDTIAEAADDLAVAFESPSPTGDRADDLEARFEEVELASARVTSFARERCGVELDPAGGPLAPAPASPTTAPG